MVEPIADSAFIVISGHNPQSGKRERISRVRTHITKRYFRRLHHKAKAAQIEGKQELNLSSGANQKPEGRNVSLTPIGNQLCSSLPFTNHLVDPSPFFAAETSQRMYKFFDIHLRGIGDSHPFYRNVVRWAISDPHFASAKVLNASGWDDLLESGKLSLWTNRQRFITMRLLNDALTNDVEGKDKHATIAATQSLLGFELLTGNDENINGLQQFYRSLITQPIQPNNEVWSVLTRCHYVLSYADRLRRIGNDGDRNYKFSISTQLPEQDTSLHPYTDDYQWPFPGNFSLFTFGQSTLAEGHTFVYVLLYDLYHILAIATSSQMAPLSRSAYEYVVSQHEQLLPYITDQNRTDTDPSIIAPSPTSAETNDMRTAPLRLSTFILVSYLLSSRTQEGDGQTQSLANLASQLRALLSSTVSGLHINTNWTVFPGALMWCHAIGLRFAGTHFDRTWFMMHFLRVAQLSALEAWEEMSRSIEMIVCSLERIGRVRVEPT